MRRAIALTCPHLVSDHFALQSLSALLCFASSSSNASNQFRLCHQTPLPLSPLPQSVFRVSQGEKAARQRRIVAAVHGFTTSVVSAGKVMQSGFAVCIDCLSLSSYPLCRYHRPYPVKHYNRSYPAQHYNRSLLHPPRPPPRAPRWPP